MNPSDQKKAQQGNPILGSPVTKRQLVVAFIIAGAADVILAPTEMMPALSLAIDLITASLLFVALGWRLILLPPLIAEAIPGIGVFPFWTMVVGSIAVFGSIRKPGDPARTPSILGETTESPTPTRREDLPTRAQKDKKEPLIIDVPLEEVRKEEKE